MRRDAATKFHTLIIIISGITVYDHRTLSTSRQWRVRHQINCIWSTKKTLCLIIFSKNKKALKIKQKCSLCMCTFNLNVYYVLEYADVVLNWGVVKLYIWIIYKSFNTEGLNMLCGAKWSSTSLIVSLFVGYSNSYEKCVYKKNLFKTFLHLYYLFCW